jgi:hypothetical protein
MSRRSAKLCKSDNLANRLQWPQLGGNLQIGQIWHPFQELDLEQ